MRKRKLGRNTSHRMLMLRNLVRSLFTYGKIKTTYFKAKELSVLADGYAALAKKGGENPSLSLKRKMFAFFDEDLTKKILVDMSPKFMDRNGGFTRVTKLGPRRGDASEMALVELIF